MAQPKRTPSPKQSPTTRSRRKKPSATESERTSLWDSVEDLVRQADEKEAARLRAEEEARKKAQMERQVRVEAEQRRERARAEFLKNQVRRQALERAILRAQDQGRAMGRVIADELTWSLERDLKKRGRTQELELTALAAKVEGDKHRMRRAVGVAVTSLCVAASALFGIHHVEMRTSAGDRQALHAQALEMESQAQARVAELEEELRTKQHLAQSEQGQLTEALRLARAEVEAARERTESYGQKKVAPRQLAARPTTLAVSRPKTDSPKEPTAPRVETTEVASPSTMAYDFGMPADQCDPHDPLCGNL